MSDVNKQLLEAVKEFFDAEQSEGREKFGHFYKPATREHQQRERIARAALHDAIAAAEQAQQAKTVTLEQLVANLKAGDDGDTIGAAMDQARADMELGRRIRERAQQSEPRCACGDSFTSDAVCANCLAAKHQAEPIAWEVRNGVVTHDFYKTAEDAEEVARDMQKSHDLSGSIAAFNVRPVYARPPAVAVPDGYVLTKIPHEYAKTLVNGGWNQYADGWNACRAAMLAAAQKGGAQ